MSRSHEIVDIIADVVSKVSETVSIVTTDYEGNVNRPDSPDINYIFGSAEYFKDYLDDTGRVGSGETTFPLVLLFCPFQEIRNNPKYYTTAKVNILIACDTEREWSNAQRKVNSFENVLRPIYRRLLEVLDEDPRIDAAYQSIRHEYSENYSYGKYGAYVDRSGEMVSVPIDAIDIRNLEINVKPINCRLS